MIGQTIAHYRIIEKLGAGGMGEVYLADDTKLERRVALKFLTASLRGDPAARERLLREAKAASRLSHQHILTTFAVEQIDNHDFIVMEYVEGESLSGWLSASERSLRDIIAVSIQILSGLARAHQSGIVHRDLKPDNIIIDRYGDAKILDFGLALLSGTARLTQDHAALGTAHYMSPEQVRGETTDPRSDLWSVGVIIYELLAGKLPFPGDFNHAVMYAILHDTPRPLSNRGSDSPADLAVLMNRALQKDVAARYQTAAEMLTALQAIPAQSGATTSSGKSDVSQKRPSVAVLPFVNMSADPDNEYFSDGLAEEIINALTKYKELRVAARTSAFSFKGKNTDVREIGQRLNVDQVLEGSVRKSGDRLRIMAQLINVEDGYHIWSERYDRDMQDVFAIQDEIAEAIVGKLTGGLFSHSEPMATPNRPANPDAHDHYLKGMFFVNQRTPDSFKRAIAHFTEAVTLHPEYALAHVGLAHTYGFAAHPAWAVLPAATVAHVALKHAEEAVRLDENLPQAWLALGLISSAMFADWPKAERALQRALQMAPELALTHHTYADHLLFMGRHEEAVETMRRAVALDPFSNVVRLNLGSRLLFANRLEEALSVIDDVIASDPVYIAAHGMRGMILAETGRWDLLHSTRSHLSYIRETTRGWAFAVIPEADPEIRRAEAKRLLREVAPQSPSMPPGVYAILQLRAGEPEVALDWLERAFEMHDYTLAVYHRLCTFDPIRTDPRFTRLLDRILSAQSFVTVEAAR